ncbi:hypothetical protein FDECE_13865 [Fusarium decemcellulare]|nr:hypothetical protein FDECE_13865 [Fusarium decemcellulare]
MEEASTNSNGSEPGHPPPKTDLVDPTGYSTNPPPSDRPVRIFIHGVTTDPDTILVKGLTVIPADDRAQVVRGCKYVDEVIQNCEPALTPEFMDEYRIDYFAHADTTEPDPYRFIKEQGNSLLPMKSAD